MSADFFLVVPPGLEELAQIELNTKVPGLEILKIEKGGISLRCPVHVGFALNHWLRIPSAVLLRIAEFKCRDLPKLFQKVSNIKWAHYYCGADFRWSISSSKSRLLNEKKILSTVSEGIARHFEKQPPPKLSGAFSQEILVRFYDDVCTLSLNTSGELLFKRGYKILTGAAPIRENLAAALYQALRHTGQSFQVLVDPMCGTGTLLFEALMFYRASTNREYAYQHLVHRSWPKPLSAEIQSAFSDDLRTVIGMDQSAQALQIFQENRGEVSRLATSDGWGGDAPTIELRKHDFFTAAPTPMPGPSFAFICNPPYNERLKVSEPPKTYYLNLIRKMAEYSPKIIGMIIPDQYLKFVPDQVAHYRLEKIYRFANGGLPVTFRIYIS